MRVDRIIGERDIPRIEQDRSECLEGHIRHPEAELVDIDVDMQIY